MWGERGQRESAAVIAVSMVVLSDLKQCDGGWRKAIDESRGRPLRTSYDPRDAPSFRLLTAKIAVCVKNSAVDRKPEQELSRSSRACG